MKLKTQSSKPVKVRKRIHNISAHARNSRLPRASFSADLKTKYARNSVRVRVGARVKLVRGEFAGIEGKIQKVYPSDGLITVEGITREKIAGGTTPVRIHSSNVVVTNVNLDDKWRRKKIQGSE